MTEDDLVKRIQAHYATELPVGERWSDPAYIYSWRNPIGYYQRERARRALVALLNQGGIDLTRCRILDIGCGTGDWLRFFAELRGDASELVGIDISPDSLRRAAQINPSIIMSQADARNLPFADEDFGMVTQFVAFQHLMERTDLLAACNEAARVCAQGGWLIWFDILPVQSDYQRGFTLADVRELFPRFQVVASQSLFRNVRLPRRSLSTAYAIARRSHLLADLVERVVPGTANNLMVLLQKNA